MLALIALAATASPAVRPSPALPAGQAGPAAATTEVTATVRILTPGRTSKDEWDKTPASRKKDVIIVELDGRKTRLRLIEFE